MANNYIAIRAHAENNFEAIKICADTLQKRGLVGKNFAQKCIEREKQFPTGLPTEIPTAIPHCKDSDTTANSICFLILDKPVKFYRMDDDSEFIETDMVFNLAIRAADEHLEVLQKLMAFLQNKNHLENCRKMSEAQVEGYLKKHLDTGSKIKLAPSIYAAHLSKLGESLKVMEENGVELLHVDVMDGSFVPRMAFGADHVKQLREMTNLPLDVHLIIQEPEKHLDNFIAAGASIITVHVESTKRLYSCLQKIKNAGIKAGAVLSPATSEETLRYVKNLVDMVLLMTVNPGESGQHFLPDVVEKIRRVRELLGEEVDLEVDGGIDAGNIKICREAGANVFVSGGYLFKGDLAENLRALRAAAQ